MKQILFIILCCVLLCGCATKTLTNTEYKEVPVLVHDTLIQKSFSHDTTIVRDSVIIQQKGDTVFYTKYKDIYKTKYIHDTVSKTVEKPVQIIKTQTKTEVQEVNVIYWWQKTLMALGIISIVLCCGLIWWKIKK